MLKSITIAGLIACVMILVGRAGAVAQDVDKLDLGALTCKQMMRLPDRDREAVMGFYFGYTAAKANNVVLNLSVAGETADKVIDDCLSNPTEKSLSVFEKHDK